MPKGTIKKIVRASLSVPGPKAGRAVREGFGIIRTKEGRELLFFHAAVEGNRFHELCQGQRVEFALDKGSLGIATSVRLEPQELACPAG